MFTGIIQCTGVIAALSRRGDERRFTIRPGDILPDLRDGESIALNGVCLSVESHTGRDYVAYASGETLARSTLGALTVGTEVNLERALALGDRLGGHLVSGHVDGVAHVRRLLPAGDSLRVEIAFPPALAPEVIPKGSVALDGISLTINDCDRDVLRVNVIPDTQKRTTMRHWRAGTALNMETDMIGKYVRRLLQCGMPPEGAEQPLVPQRPEISRDFLLRHGFL